MATVGVLCARVRVEEKQLMAALAEAGALPTPLPPADVPLPVGLPTGEPAASAAGGSGEVPAARLIVDRCQDRAVAAAILTVCRATGATTLDAGLAATGDRLAVAGALAAAGLPRPQTRLVCSEAAALIALAELGYPGTLLPLAAGTAPITLLDVDTAEAVVEHRAVLGSTHDALALVQAGAPDREGRATVIVVDGRAVAATVGEGVALPAAALRLAEAAADALGAVVVGIDIALTGGGPIIWDVQAVPEFRAAVPIAGATVAAALATAAVRRLPVGNGRDSERGLVAGVGLGEPRWERENGRIAVGREVADGVVLSA